MTNYHSYEPKNGYGLAHDPFNAIVGFSSVGYKDTVRNVAETGEFVWNLVTIELIQQMNQSSFSYPQEVSEFDVVGLTKIKSARVIPPRVAQAKLTFECKSTDIVQLKGISDEKVPTWLILGEVVKIHISNFSLKNGVYDTSGASHVLRARGPVDYFTVSQAQRISLRRPESAWNLPSRL